MRVIVAVLLALIICQTSSTLCETCIKASVFIQSFLIAVAPEKPAREIVEAVCERQCNFLLIQTNPLSFARKFLKS